MAFGRGGGIGGRGGVFSVGGGGSGFREGGGRGRGFGGGGGRGRVGRGNIDHGPPERVIQLGFFSYACAGDLICKVEIDDVPYFNAPIYLENKKQIGKIDEIFGTVKDYSVVVKLSDNMKSASFKPYQKLFIDPQKLLPIARFLPKPPQPKRVKKSGVAGGRSGRGGSGRGGRGGGGSNFNRGRGGFDKKRGGRGCGFMKSRGRRQQCK